VRLRNGYVIRCNEVLKDEQGNIQQLNCTYDPETLGKDPSDRKVKGVIHWVDAAASCPAEVRLYDRLFSDETPDAHKERPFTHFINDQSLTIIYPARVEANLAKALPEKAYQFEREGYFCLDEQMTQQKGHLVFNRTIALRDSWQKLTTGEK